MWFFNICDAIKQNESEVKKTNKQTNKFYFFLAFAFNYYLSFNLVKAPRRLGNWFYRYRQLKGCKKKKERKEKEKEKIGNKETKPLCLPISSN